ncbi:heme-binding beta-barrel domain-containing protein [Planctomicrobium sp. SH661]|uniref:heme-binding beta-barrel domain-containing protein n=1 Tax=Planctomicrobium sp. SH661 TaxID=3448124 RepID=UPI003F5B6FBC
MTSNPQCSESWGPLKPLIGKWAGAREKQNGPRHLEHFYEVRTFQRRSTVPGSSHSPQIFPLLFSIRLFDFHQRERQISEETGYLLWTPESQRVSQLTLQPTGVFRFERATMEEAEQSCCLIFDSQRHDSHLLAADLDSQGPRLHAVESTMVYDASTFRFDQSFRLQADGNSDFSYREVGELIRIDP